MAETMRAVVLKGPRQLELMEIPRPTLTTREQVLVRVEACGICGSDLRYWHGENPWALHTLGRHVDNLPNMILGHELSGVVAAVNTDEHEHLVGQRVGVQAFRVCGRCDLCRSGRENLCRNTVHIGHAQGWGEMEYCPGGYADYCIAWADVLHPMADHVTFEEEAMRDILGVAVHAVGRGGVGEGATVLCLGGGTAGLCIAQVAKARGAQHVAVVDTSPLARRIIGQYQGLGCLDPSTQSVPDMLRQLTGQTACSAIFDTVGTAETMEQALPLLAEAGTYVNLAVQNVPVSLNAQVLGSERTITASSNAFYRDEREAHDMIASAIVNVHSMITHRLPLGDFEEAFGLLLREPREAYKVVFQIGDE